MKNKYSCAVPEKNFYRLQTLFFFSLLTVCFAVHCAAQAVDTASNNAVAAPEKLRYAIPQMPCEKPQWPKEAL